jgi:hypothetical protein
MGTVLRFKVSSAGGTPNKPARGQSAEIVIFPGVRIERHETDLDLGYRVMDSAGGGSFDGVGGGRRPRKTS